MSFPTTMDALAVAGAQPPAPQSAKAEAVPADAAVQAQALPRELAPETRSKIAERLQDLARVSGRELEFRIDEASGRTVISVRDERTGEIIRQIPDATALRIAQRLESQAEVLRNVLIEDRA
jgi:flagellar protein FlaG